MAHYVYIIQSFKYLGYYIGETSNVEARLKFYNKGLQRSTRYRMPFKIVRIEVYSNRNTALKREKEIKSWKVGLKLIKLLESSSPAQRGTTFGILQLRD